ncbi:MAG: MFS transporter [Myxococcales bacterium]|nr:MFS transporter [Myxococcales bacterium]
MDQPQLHLRSIFANTIAFAVAFALWVLMGPSVRSIAAELGLTDTQAAAVKALPILTGSVLRIPIGMLTDRIGARVTFSGLMLFGGVSAALVPFATGFGSLVVGCLAIGLVGTTFVVGVQSVVSWNPPTRHGAALGWFGAGNAGTAITTLAAPFLLPTLGWRATFWVYAVAMLATGVMYAVTMRDVERTGPPRSFGTLAAPLADPIALGFGLLYAANFGVYVAATLLLIDLYIDGYGVSLATAGMLATTFTLTGAMCRIPGGWAADRFGAAPILTVTLIATALLLLPLAAQLPLPMMVGFTFLSAVAMGFGMTATVKALPEAFPETVGAVGGIVGAIGGLGGFFLPLAATRSAALLGTPAAQMLPLAGMCLVALGVHFAIRGRLRARAEVDSDERMAA